jgi:hypothetical protein
MKTIKIKLKENKRNITKGAINGSFHRLGKNAFEHDVKDAFSVLRDIARHISKFK